MTLPKAIAFDSDNTLTVSKQDMSAQMAALFSAITCKIPTAIISGAGMPQYMNQLIDHLPDTTCLDQLYLFPSTGAACFVHEGSHWSSLYSHDLTQNEARTIMHRVEEALEETRLVAGEPRYGELIENRGASIAFSGLGQQAPVSEKERWDPDHLKRKRIVNRIAPDLPDFEVRIGGMTTIDITRKGIDKGYAMEWFAKHLSLHIQEMVYVGDALYEGGNDAAVIPTGIQTYPVKNPGETEALLRQLLE